LARRELAMRALGDLKYTCNVAARSLAAIARFEPPEAMKGHRHGNRNVHADHARLHTMAERARTIAVEACVAWA
jgi:LmbE family N-acetylglucosaminyl deacetylase